MSGHIIKQILPDEQIHKVDLHEGLYSKFVAAFFT